MKKFILISIIIISNFFSQLNAEIVNKIIINKVSWNGLAKKSGIEIGDIISNFKVENLDRPNKAIVYPFALLFLFGFGYFNYKRKEN